MRLLTALVPFALAACSQLETDTAPMPDSTPTSAVVSNAGDPLALWPMLDAATKAGDNIVYSPVSTAQALGLVHLGSRGETAGQIEAFLGNGAGNVTDQGLAQQRRDLSPENGSRIRLKTANALFLSSDFSFRDSYLNDAKSFYAATTETVDFDDQPGEAADAINRWADMATDGLIKQVTDTEAINRDAAAYLTNATFFEGGWLNDFRKTERGKFLFEDGTERDFMLMSREGRFATATRAGWRAVRLPYSDQRFVMDVMLPIKRQVELPDITPASIALLGDALGKAEEVSLRPILPRFQASMKQDLIVPLRAVVVTLPFSRNEADLSGIIEAGGPRLFIEEAYQMAKLEVFEQGTRAAAVTVMVAVPVSAPPPFDGEDFPVDQPFLFAIRDLQTGVVLFFGRIGSPQVFNPSS